MQGLRSVWEWLKKWWGVFAGAIGIGLAVLVGAFVVARRREVGRAMDQLAIDRAVDEITVLKQVRDGIRERGEDKDGEIERLDDEIARNRRAIVEAHENAEDLTDEEIDAEFARLGY